MSRWDSTPVIRFFGGRKLLYLLGVVLLVGLNILVFSSVGFIFNPLLIFIKTIALPLILSVVVYYLLRPIINLLEAWRIKRIWGILITLLALVGIITLLVVLIIPFLEKQLISLSEELPRYLRDMIKGTDEWLRNSIFSVYYTNLFQDVDGMLNQIPDYISSYASETVEGITSIISTVTSVVVAIVTLPFILFYLLKDGYRLPAFVIRLFPPKFRPEISSVFKGIDHQLSAYIQGQIIVSFCIGVMMYIGFLIIGLDYALLLAAIASVTSVVPYLGPIIAITPALIISIVTSPFMVVKLVIVWTIVQLLEGKFISPQIMGKSLHIHPVTIIFVLLTAGHLFGVIGIILAIPGYAILKVIVSHMYFWFQRRYNRFVEEEDQYKME
ncbi:Predicted PurR-regulated permease PerM [Halobacillus karajensis]|uniref:Transport of quorum-sensing signal protein n=1 Tax=Halobacillus karajensis TaxID=195088 RepID=A0A024P9W2_9BACI|nr:AI-2E family transporter [Halobacillus karajensis]CDQ21596.1 Transport of quorum-sensing signal protein [Halobacillus karajensis]CDQ25531.1 Transport of quorum-sensing signal protein [Halobacillus karajensis]CDQ28939.1 Transport of quorum-sensing signal protein [Halobacillus karajensis]SEI08649.1 Predicted PurR-regulated permease PerM [Halobacillus karajensis]